MGTQCQKERYVGTLTSACLSCGNIFKQAVVKLFMDIFSSPLGWWVTYY